VIAVRRGVVDALAASGYLPVISPVSRSIDGGSLNVNADDAAAALAVGLAARRFLLVTNVPGVLRDTEVVAEIETGGGRGVDRLNGVASGGMGPKLRAAAVAAAAGVSEVRIGDLEMLRDGNAGSRVMVAPYHTLSVGTGTR
jgi:acetylglutamate kinase